MPSINNAFRLSPLQEGMLFQCIAASSVGSLYYEQLILDVVGNVSHFDVVGSWKVLQSQYEVLRSFFSWENLQVPHQIIVDSAPLPVEYHCLKELSDEAFSDACEVLLQQDRLRGFDLSKPPLLRLIWIEGALTKKVIFSFHHLILDGWSMSLLIDHWFHFLSSPLEPVESASSFSRYLGWSLEQAVYHDKLFWQTYLAEAEPTTLPVTRAAEFFQKGEYRVCEFALDAGTTQRLKQTASEQGARLSSYCLTVFALWLSLQNGRSDQLFGLVTSGRFGIPAEFTRTLGLLMNTLPIRVQASGLLEASTFASVARQVDSDLLALHQREATALGHIRQWCHIAWPSSMFEVVCLFENYPTDNIVNAHYSNFYVQAAELREEMHFPMTVWFIPGEQLRVRVAYDSGRYNSDAMSENVDQLQQLLQRSDGTHKSADEPLLRLSGDTVPITRPFLTDFYDQCQQTPDAPAIADRGSVYSYGRLAQKLKALNLLLQQQGIRPDTRVALLLEPSANLIIAILAVLQSRASFVCLDSSFPVQKTSAVLSKTQSRYIITDDNNEDHLPVGLFHTINLDEVDLDEIPIVLEQQADSDWQLSDEAYAICTSGSTGDPKAIVINHLNLANYLAWCRDHYFSEELQGLCGGAPLVTSPAFDLTITTLLAPLAVGRCVRIPGNRLQFDSLMDEVVTRGVFDFIKMTPSQLKILVPSWQHSAHQRLTRRLIVGGEQLSAQLAAVAQALDPSMQIINEYGPTETTVGCISKIYDGAQLDGVVAIGRPHYNITASIRSERGAVVNPGQIGELLIEGVSVGRILPAEQGYCYPTGDRVYLDGQGDLVFVDRADSQLKISGYRVDAEEIDAVVASVTGIRAASVFRYTLDDEWLLGCYILLDEGAEDDLLVRIRHCCLEALPAPLVPSTFFCVDALPVSASGKAVRRCNVPEGRMLERAVRDQTAKNADEEKVASVWKQVLKLDQVSVDANFFDLGGTSLLLIKVAAGLQEAFSVRVEIGQLFDCPNLRDMAALVRASGKGDVIDTSANDNQDKRRGYFNLVRHRNR